MLTLLFILTGCSLDTLPDSSPPQEPSAPSIIITEETPQPSTQMEYSSPDYKEVNDLNYDENDAINEMRDVIESCKNLIEKFSSVNAIDGVYFDVSEEERQALLSRIGEMGYVVADERMDMGNAEQFRQFYNTYEAKGNAEIGIYRFNGKISRTTFICRDGIIYHSLTNIEWDSAMNPVIEFNSKMNELEIFMMTPKGHLFYGSAEPSNLKFRSVAALRVEPLGSEKRRIFNEYVAPLVSYASTAIFSTDWDVSDYQSLHLNDVFEFLYMKDYGIAAENVFKEAYPNGGIILKAVPNDVFEAIIIKYFPITAEELRTVAVYDPDKRVYAFEPMMLPDASPDWEVVDFTENKDGTLTIVMDGVCPENLMERSVSNIFTIQLKEDGSFQYLSNRLTRYDDKLISSVPGFQQYNPRVK